MKFSLAVFLAFSAFSAYAGPISLKEVAEKSALGLHLLSLAEGAEPVWKTQEEVDALVDQDVRFFDITETYDPSEPVRLAKDIEIQAIYPPPAHKAEVNAVIETLSLPQMQSYLTDLTTFNNRYYTSTTGRDASYYIRDTVAAINSAFPTSRGSVSLFNHSWIQPSIIAKIPGSVADTPLTILGGHMDTTSGRAPGADDDGSGTVNLLEAYRALITSGFKPRTPVEFQWYAAEETGLRGSQAIARAYKTAGVQVKGMLQLDMTAYVKPGTAPVVGLMPDYTDKNLTAFVGQLVDTYTPEKWVTNQACGYACSDHASFYNQGYPTALPFESLFSNDNPNIHTNRDTVTVNGFNWTHSFQYAKIAVGFAYELAV